MRAPLNAWDLLHRSETQENEHAADVNIGGSAAAARTLLSFRSTGGMPRAEASAGYPHARLRCRKFKKHEMVGCDPMRSGPAPHRPTCVSRPSMDSLCWRATAPTTTAPGTIRGDPGRGCGLAVRRNAQRRKFRRGEGIDAENRGPTAHSTAGLLNFRPGRGRAARWQIRGRSLRVAAQNGASTSSRVGRSPRWSGGRAQ